MQLTQLEKSYVDVFGKKFKAVTDINLQIYQGDFISVMGPSGSGKTTLANIIGLLTLPTAGTMHFLNKPCESMTDSALTELRRKHIGFIFQDYMLIEHMSVLQNVMLSMLLDPKPTSMVRVHAEKILNHIGMSDHKHKLPRQLSGGQKQRAAIARVLVKQPTLILADEPTGALDPKSRLEIMTLLQNLNELGTTIVMVTHNIEDARVGSRLIKIKDAKIFSDQQVVDRILYSTAS